MVKFEKDVVLGESFVFYDGKDVYASLTANYNGMNYSVVNKKRCKSIFSPDFVNFLGETRDLLLEKIIFDVSCNPILTEEKGAQYVNLR